MKKRLPTILLILVFVIGLSLLLYPTAADYWNSLHQTRAVTGYAQAVAGLDDGVYQALWDAAEDWNRRLYASGRGLSLPEEYREEYESLLNVSGSGMMGYIEIPKLDCALPIYHGTDSGTLQSAVGHIEGSSLPVGGESTHCVLSGHRGLPSARLFTDLDQLAEGDVFLLRTLDETLTYEVDQILIVLPEEVSSLAIQEGEDLCTLVTCTPYGVNSHRLLVRGHRVDNQAGEVRVTADARQIEVAVAAPLVAAPMLLILLAVLLVRTRKRKKS